MTETNKQGELIQFLQSAESVHGGAFNSGYTYEDYQYVGNALNQAIGFISRQSELEQAQRDYNSDADSDRLAYLEKDYTELEKLNQELVERMKVIAATNEGSKRCVICGEEGGHKIVCPVYIAEQALERCKDVQS